MPKIPDIFVVMPAYNAEKTLIQTYNDIPKDIVKKIILVDDKSHDQTVKVARDLGLTIFEHPVNKGYGGNQKTCYTMALEQGAEIVVMLHPDYQYDPKIMAKMVRPIINGSADIVLGSRMLDGSALPGGMPKYKYAANKFLTFCENVVLGLNLSEYHTGYRAYSRKVLETLPFTKNSDNFVFDQEFLIQAVYFGFKITEVACPCKYMDDASSISFKNSVVYGLSTLQTLARYLGHKLCLKNSKFLEN
ncbi:MAG TPA: glycosyltransferase family 2 protein [Candidatus Wallbacteria bacterium]|nr:MAG: Undecaprenyl-phosphate mannosyltransferase [bacterium ADurb.Bin243]HOD39907.1 glycosyltransferase family 2 protein [Candidatus Wallbacteria bacterium]HPG57302.1 glycosyltransferase family 2 protein [Candidatus Wallbacteria bacterium]